MAQLNLNSKHYDKKDCLAINIGDRTYHMPLANAMPVKVLKNLTKDADIDTILTTLSPYIPEDVLGELSMVDLKSIFDAWGDASAEVTGVELGK